MYLFAFIKKGTFVIELYEIIYLAERKSSEKILGVGICILVITQVCVYTRITGRGQPSRTICRFLWLEPNILGNGKAFFLFCSCFIC